MKNNPDPKLSIVEEFRKFLPHVLEKVKLWGSEDGYTRILKREFESFLLAALEAHGKAERETGRQEVITDSERTKDDIEVLLIESHAAGFTEGVQKCIETIEILPAKTFKSPAEKHTIILALEALKPKDK